MRSLSWLGREERRPKSVRWYRLSGGRGGKNAHMAYRDWLADDMRGFWGEKGLRASHEKRIVGSQVGMMEGKRGGGERVQGRLQGREKYRWHRTRASRASAVSARLPHTLHIWSYHGPSRRRSSSEERVALPAVVAQLTVVAVSSTTPAIVLYIKLKIRTHQKKTCLHGISSIIRCGYVRFVRS
jgi:hypothetical protein